MKSTPAILSFDEDYKIDQYEEKEPLYNSINKDWCDNKEKLFVYGEENTGHLYNARLKALFETVFDKEEQHKLLFIPPSNPHGDLKGVFEGRRGVSKRLYFSEYRMTTKSLSAMLSYEAERRAYCEWRCKAEGFTEIPLTQKSDIVLKWNEAKKEFFFEAKNEKKINKDDIIEELREGDKDKPVSIYNLVEELKRKHKKLDSSLKDFVSSYFKYMTSQYSLLVLMGNLYDKNKNDENNKQSLLDLILQYSEDGCLKDVLDEYIFCRCPEENEEFPFFGVVGNKELFDLNYSVTAKLGNCSVPYKFKTNFAFSHNSEKKNSQDENDSLENKINRFNSPFLPFRFVSTSIGQEGFDFHLYCRRIVHWSLDENAVHFEQKEGRINRFHCYANRLQAVDIYKKRGQNSEKASWDDIYSYLRKDKTSIFGKNIDSYGLVPDFLFPDNNITEKNNDLGLVREFYYYPFSYEDMHIETVLQNVGYYRALLGSYGDDAYEESFRRFISDKKNKDEYFINLSSVRPNEEK